MTPNQGTCRSCGAPIIWTRTERGSNMPGDPDPSPHGNLLLDRYATMQIVGSRVVKPDEEPRAPALPLPFRLMSQRQVSSQVKEPRMPERKAQRVFDEHMVEDAALEESCAAVEQYRTERKAARQAILSDALKRFAAREQELREEYQIESDEARVEAAQATFAADFEVGDRIRTGPYVWEVKEYVTMEKVESGKGKRVRGFSRVDG